MGAATAMALVSSTPTGFPRSFQITPAYTGYARHTDVAMETWERLASELEAGGVDAFVEVAQPDGIPEHCARGRRATRQRMERHEHPEAVAQALSMHLDRLEGPRGAQPHVPVLIVGSRNNMRPLGVAGSYERKLRAASWWSRTRASPSPLAWQGARLSRRDGKLSNGSATHRR